MIACCGVGLGAAGWSSGWLWGAALGGGGGFCQRLAVDGLGEVGAHGDELVQDLAVVLRVLVALARFGAVGWVGEGGGGGHRGA